MRTRIIIVVAVLVSAAVHLRLWGTGVRHEHVVGPAFMVNGVAGVVIAALLLSWRHWVPLFLAFGFGVCTFGAFVVAATVGLFGVQEHWAGGYVWAAAVSEVVAVVTAVVAAAREGHLTAVSGSRSSAQA